MSGVIVTAPPSSTPPRPGDLEVIPFNKSTVRRLSVIHVFLGVVCVVAEIIYWYLLTSNPNGCKSTLFWAGTWTGGWHVLVGLVGFLGSHKATRSRVYWFFALTIISFLAATIGLVISLVIIAIIYTNIGCDEECCYEKRVSYAQITLIIAHTLQGSIVLYSCTLGCRGACCGSTAVLRGPGGLNTTTHVVVTAPSLAPGQYQASEATLQPGQLPAGVASVAQPYNSSNLPSAPSLQPPYNPSYGGQEEQRSSTNNQGLPSYEQALIEGAQPPK